MARTIIVLAVLLFVEGCAFPPEFIPTTMRGAECKSARVNVQWGMSHAEQTLTGNHIYEKYLY
jgi:hypothetical protein